MIGQKNAIGWFVILVFLCGFSFFQVKHHWRIQTDILALLPKDDQDATVRSLKRLVSEKLGRTALVLVSHVEPEVARAATRQLGLLMASSAIFSDAQWDYRHQQQAFFDLYFPLRYQVVSPALRHYLVQDDGYQYVVKRLKRELYQPTSAFLTRFLEDDPLLFFPELMKSWRLPTGHLRVDEGLLGTQRDGKYHYLITATLASNPFEERTQIQMEENWQRWAKSLRRTYPGLELAQVSMARFAASARRQMQRDILIISIGSILGITGLIVGTFRSLKHLILALIPLAVGLWSALGLSLFIFGELHALTLVFGASLIGIYIDYSFHYFARHRVSPVWEPRIAMRQILPALSLGAVSTLLSYAGLGLTPLVGLQQIAVFASCGLLVSFLTVVFGFPFLLLKPHSRVHDLPLLYRGSKHVLSTWTKFLAPIPPGDSVAQLMSRSLTVWRRFKILLYGLLAAVLVLSAKGILNLQVDDRPQALSVPSKDLAAQDRMVRRILGVSQTQRYLVVEGKTAEAALQQLEAFQKRVRTEPDQYGVSWGPILTDFVPSKKRQREDAQAVRKLLKYKPEISQELQSLGFPSHRVEAFFRLIEKPPEKFLSPAVWQRHQASRGLRELWLGETSEGAVIWVPINRLRDVARLQEAISGFPGIGYLDQVADFTRILKRYRQRAMRLVGLAYVVILLLLIWRYGARGFVVMLPPLFAAFITLGFLGLLGQAINLMHCLALLLMLGMGVDYTIFLVESAPSSEPTALLALSLSALTTELSFGLLSMSSQAMLKAIGLTTLVGIFCAWWLAPLATYRRSR